MKYMYFPGCSLKSTGRAYEESIVAVFRALEIELQEIDDWNCCGATAYFSIDEKQAFGLATRNLALAESQSGSQHGTGTHLIAPCSACFLVLTKSQKYFAMYDEVRQETIAALDAAALSYHGTVSVRHPIDVLVNDYGLDMIAKKISNPLKNWKVASYYGCQLTRPFATFDHAMYPITMDKLVEVAGAKAIDWPLKTRCCGGSLTGTIPEAGLRLNQHLLVEAIRKGANTIITCCPLCQFNLECYQDTIRKKYGERVDIPVMYFTQFLGLALGIPEKELGIHRLFVPPTLERTSAKKGAPAHA